MTVFSPISVHVVMFNFKVKRCMYTDVYTYTSASTETTYFACAKA